MRAAVAERWSVAAEAVRLEWPRAGVPDSVAADRPVAIAGEGRDGWLVVRVGSGPGATALRVRAGAPDSVTVAARPLAPMQRIGAGDVRRELRSRWGAPAPGAEPVTGWEVRRALAEGEVLAPPAVRPPFLIAPGDPVRVSWARGEVRLALAGIALNGARRGEPLRVRIEGRPAPLAAFASGPGTALLESGGER